MTQPSILQRTLDRMIYVGIGEYAISDRPDAILKTFALGSCVGVIVHDPQLSLTGLLHVALPDSSINPERAIKSPGVFADTGIVSLISDMRLRGMTLSPGLSVKLIGGASILDTQGRFNIGLRNINAAKRKLTDLRLAVCAEDVGGQISRTVAVHVGSGRVIITSPGLGDWEV